MASHSLLLLIEEINQYSERKIMLSAPDTIFDQMVELLDQFYESEEGSYVCINTYYKNCIGLNLAKRYEDENTKVIVDKLATITGWRYDTESRPNGNILFPAENSPVKIHLSSVTFPVSKVLIRVWNRDTEVGGKMVDTLKL